MNNVISFKDEDSGYTLNVVTSGKGIEFNISDDAGCTTDSCLINLNKLRQLSFVIAKHIQNMIGEALKQQEGKGGLPTEQYYERIRDGLIIEIVKFSKDKTVVYVRKKNLVVSNIRAPQWPIFIRNFWRYYKPIDKEK